MWKCLISLRYDRGKRLYYSTRAGTSDYLFHSESIIAEQCMLNDDHRYGWGACACAYTISNISIALWQLYSIFHQTQFELIRREVEDSWIKKKRIMRVFVYVAYFTVY